jgi:hypothetical protein
MFPLRPFRTLCLSGQRESEISQAPPARLPPLR